MSWDPEYVRQFGKARFFDFAGFSVAAGDKGKADGDVCWVFLP